MPNTKTIVKPVAHTVSLKDVLLKGNYVSSTDIQKALLWAKTNKTTVAEYLLTQGLITKDLLGQAMAEFYAVPYADINSKTPSREQVLKVPEDIARANRVVLFAEDASSVTLATDNPLKAHPLQVQLQTRFPNKKFLLRTRLRKISKRVLFIIGNGWKPVFLK